MLDTDAIAYKEVQLHKFRNYTDEKFISWTSNQTSNRNVCSFQVPLCVTYFYLGVGCFLILVVAIVSLPWFNLRSCIPVHDEFFAHVSFAMP